MKLTLEALLDGYSDPKKGEIVALEDIKGQYANEDDVKRLTIMNPLIYRYLEIVSTINDAASLMQLTRDRLQVAVEYVISLADIMANYDGIHKDQKIVGVPLTDRQKEMLRAIPIEIGFDEQKQIEYLDSIIRHDLTATMDWLKMQLLTRPELGLEDYAEAVHWNLTSDDVNSVAFGMMNTVILKEAVLPTILSFQEQLIEYALRYDALAISGLTHGQPAEFTTLSKRFMNIASAIDDTLQKFLPYDEKGERMPLLFPGKMGAQWAI